MIGDDPNTGYMLDNLWVPKSLVNVEGVKKALTFTYFEGRDRDLKELPLFREMDHHLVVPREFYKKGQFHFPLVDCRPRSYARTNIISRIQLDHKEVNGVLVPTGESTQQDALAKMLNARNGILELGCGKGKTIIALHSISVVQTPALIVVDNMQLLDQWVRSIEKFLEVPGGLGLVGDGEFDWEGKFIVLATYQSLASKIANGQIDERFRRWFGQGYYDEAHHVNAPTFSRSADLLYERRYGLSATPNRDDGLHVIHQFHFGPSFYKDLKQELRPTIYFQWTGCELDLTNPEVVAGTHTAQGELHLSMLATWFGQWVDRLHLILDEIRNYYLQGRKILVLSNSVDELVNALALWNGMQELYTDIPAPPLLNGEPEPLELTKKQRIEVVQEIDHLSKLLPTVGATTQREVIEKMQRLEEALAAHDTWRRVSRIVNRNRKKYREELLAKSTDAGLMIHKVPTATRTKLLREKQITFAIMKYGKEGLDEPSISTVVLMEPTSSKNAIQQIMGRALRFKERKHGPIFHVFEDNIKPIIGMCKSMRSKLRKWPVEDGGPYAYEFRNYPDSARRLR